MPSTNPIRTTKELQSYSGYEDWKGWIVLFACDEDMADYFRIECAGMRITGANVLEIGFGSGSFLAWAKSQGATLFGTELIPSLNEEAKRFGVEVLATDLESVSHHHREKFDSIMAFDVFEHMSLDEIQVRLHTLSSILKPGGQLLMRFPNAQSPFGLAPQFGDPTHKCGLSRGVFEQLTQGSEWQILRYGGAARAPGRSALKRIIRAARYALQDVIAHALNAIYAQNIPWDPVVVIVLRRNLTVR